MRIVGLDLSLTRPGFGIWDGNRIVEFGYAPVPKDLRSMPRLHWIAEWVIDKTAGADLILLEGYAFARPEQAHYLGELGGVVRLALWCQNRRYTDVSPSALKKFVTGKGNAQKDLMMLCIYKRFGIETDDNNAADAVGLTFIGAALVTEWAPTTKEQADVLYQIQHPGQRPPSKSKVVQGAF